MVQGNDSLEVNSKSELDDCASMSNDNASVSSEDTHMLNDELDTFCAVSYTHLTLPTIYSV